MAAFPALGSHRALLFMPAVVAAASLAAAASFDGETGPELCFFRRCTGGYCPGCGGSRSVVALAKGDLAASWTIHPFVPLLALQLLIVAATRGRVAFGRWIVPALGANLCLLLVIWATRLATGAIAVPFS